MLIPRKVLSSLIVASDDASGRYALGGLRIERDPSGKAVAAATDGRRMMCVEWDDSKTSEETPQVGGVQTGASPDCDFSRDGMVLPVDVCKSIARAAKPRVSALRRKPELGYIALEEASANGTVKLAASDGETVAESTAKTLEGRFPHFRDVIPNYNERVSHFTFQDEETCQRQISKSHFQERDALEKLYKDTKDAPAFPGSAAVRVRVDAKYLSELADAIHKMAGSDVDKGLTLIVPLDPRCPVVLEKETDDIKIQSVLMPLSIR